MTAENYSIEHTDEGEFIDVELTYEQELQADHAKHVADGANKWFTCPLCDDEYDPIDFIDGDPDDEDDEPVSCVGPTGLRVLKEQCSTCIFRPGNLMHLNSGRLKDMTESVEASQTYVICHQTLDQPLGAVCRGSYDKVPTRIHLGLYHDETAEHL